MAVTSNAMFNNAIVGTPQVGVDVDTYETHKNPSFAVGTMFERQDGARFRYSHFGADTTVGYIVSQDVSESSIEFTENAIIDPGSGTNVPGETMAHNAIGSRYIELTDSATAHSANYYAGAYLIVSDGTAEGPTYRIKGSTLTGNPTSGRMRLELYRSLVEALDATTDIQIVGCKWANLEPAVDGSDEVVAGVACTTVDISEKAFGWVQTRGICGVKFQEGDTGAAADVGRLISLDQTTAGTAEITAADAAGLSGSALADEIVNEFIIGRYAMPPVGVAVTSVTIAVDLTIE